MAKESKKKSADEKGPGRDVTRDFLLCNRCGTCRYVCPLLPVFREEWAGARGKVELAEAFFAARSSTKRMLGRYSIIACTA